MGLNISTPHKINKLQGKRTFLIVHDIINCCDDSDMILTVKMFRRNICVSSFEKPDFDFILIFIFEQLAQLSQQSGRRCPIVTCGFFVCDCTLIFKVRMKFIRCIRCIHYVSRYERIALIGHFCISDICLNIYISNHYSELREFLK